MRKIDPARQAEKRQDILLAAARCFVRDGFRGATIAGICAEAKISPGNLYYYFTGKEAIVDAMAASNLAAAAAQFDLLRQGADPMMVLIDEIEASHKESDTRGHALQFDIFAEAGRNPAIAEIVRGHSRALRQMLADYIRDAQAEGKIDPTLDPEMTGAVLLTAIGGLGMLSYNATDLDLAEGFELYKTMIVRLLCPRPAAS